MVWRFIFLVGLFWIMNEWINSTEGKIWKKKFPVPFTHANQPLHPPNAHFLLSPFTFMLNLLAFFLLFWLVFCFACSRKYFPILSTAHFIIIINSEKIIWQIGSENREIIFTLAQCKLEFLKKIHVDLFFFIPGKFSIPTTRCKGLLGKKFNEYFFINFNEKIFFYSNQFFPFYQFRAKLKQNSPLIYRL